MKQSYQHLWRKIGLVLCSVMSSSYSNTSEAHRPPTTFLDHVLIGSLRHDFSLFLDNVLKQVPSQAFFQLIDNIEQCYHPTNDREWYQHIVREAPTLKNILGKYTPLYRLYALKHQRNILSNHLTQLISAQAPCFKTCVEIGTPGTYIASIRASLPHIQKIISITHTQKSTDIVEGFSWKSPFKPYDEFVPLNNYSPITGIPQGSVDLIICTIGLHHIPIHKLDSFVASLRSILKPGGIFILRDHDITNESTLRIVYAAHSTFNALLANTTLDHELQEYRHFQPLSYWVQLLEKHGFTVSHERITQDGDPTRNTCIKAIANVRDQNEHAISLTHSFTDKPGYARDILQTYCTTPEWLSVDIAEEYSNFINHTPFFEFPWMQHVHSFWKVFGASCKTAIKRRGVLPVIASSYMLMNLFIGTTLTIEHILKALISVPIRWMYSQTEDKNLKAVAYDPLNEIHSINPHINTLEEHEHHLKLIEIPRYKAFLHTIKKLPQTTNLEIFSISGQTMIFCKIRSRDNSHRTLPSLIPGCIVEFEWTLPTQPLYTYAGITVPIKALKQFVQCMNNQNNELMYIHDF